MDGLDENSGLTGNALIRAEKEAVRKAASRVTLATVARRSSPRADLPVAQMLTSRSDEDSACAKTAKTALATARAFEEALVQKQKMNSPKGAKASAPAQEEQQSVSDVDVTESSMNDVKSQMSVNNEVQALRNDVDRVLEDLENLVWWTCKSDAQKQSWMNLLGDIRKSVRDMEAKVNESLQATQEELESARTELEELRSREMRRSMIAPWVPDAEARACARCDSQFTFFFRRHHCRCCGEVVCGTCSDHSAPVPQWGYERPIRVCSHCYTYGQQRQISSAAPASP
mmetsp:Transcript_12045/g.23563  ORF Transcript_12045/g.23563 Transcript_12045/m.23563 type:complete len:286 (+) Transcript_12045:650-1507(+)|eukprot:CAMPEP_0171499578 /NCGR_PEP_ID=MMETSP0958-20121227/8510_1 /TAXON_ID=87120 /ORGANISM="Aurantiochytrium limacinum, Strain ATCCMYA-1381" /LENGTH=285 /DNA_ID=CAMNT_0012034157 /DNA_START=412 /DNA_END=1269 /DNA_ORIENTATION=-